MSPDIYSAFVIDHWMHHTYRYGEQARRARLGYLSEVGEFAGEVKRHLHRDKPQRRDELLLELGDVLFYATRLLQLGRILEEHYPPRLDSADLVDCCIRLSLPTPDTMYLINKAADLLGSNRKEVMQLNVDKLTKRRPLDARP